MTLPTLTPCPVPDCRAPITHHHGASSGDLYACTSALNGRPCPHDQDDPCYAPRETAPLHLPDVDTAARKIYESDGYPTTRWDDESEAVKDDYRRNARDVLDLIAAHQPVWQRVEPGTLIKEGTRYRRVCADDSSYERIAESDFISRGVISIDTRTIPAPEDPRVEVLAEEMEAEYPHCDDEWPCAGAERFRGAARRAIARLDAMGGEGK